MITINTQLRPIFGKLQTQGGAVIVTHGAAQLCQAQQDFHSLCQNPIILKLLLLSKLQINHNSTQPKLGLT